MGVGLMGRGVGLLDGVGRCPLPVKAESVCGLNDFAIEVPYIVAEFVGVKDSDLLRVWEVFAKGD